MGKVVMTAANITKSKRRLQTLQQQLASAEPLMRNTIITNGKFRTAHRNALMPGSSFPSKVDYPSIEGIGAAFLVLLLRQTDIIRDFSGSFRDMPRMGMPFADVADIFRSGANFIIPDLTLTIRTDYSMTLPMLYEHYIRKDSLIESGLFDPSTTGFFIGSVSSNRGITGKDWTAAKKGAKE